MISIPKEILHGLKSEQDFNPHKSNVSESESLGEEEQDLGILNGCSEFLEAIQKMWLKGLRRDK